jgi:subtilisin family serine protease
LLTSVLCAVSACAVVEPAQDQAAAMLEMRTHPDQMVVVLVANPPQTLMLRAGTTPAGYGAPAGYSQGGTARATIAALARQYGLKEESAWPIAPLKADCAMLEIVGDESRDEVLAKLSSDPRVRLAQPLQTFELRTDAPTGHDYASLQRGLHEIGADAAQRIALGNSVRVAVIDTGVDTGHPDLREGIVATRNVTDNDWAQFNRDIHGTEVAGVIGAGHRARAATPDVDVKGVAPHVDLIAIKACWQSTQPGNPSVCHSFTLAEALEAALEEHARIVNLSLSGPHDPLLTEMVSILQKKGVVVVGAVAPNGDLNSFPADVPGVIPVAAAGEHGTTPAISDPRVLYAPGHDILTLAPGGHYDFASGSSLATAEVTGTIALLVGLQPRLDAEKVAALLEGTSGPTPQHTLVINACRAIASLGYPCSEAIR